MNTCILFYLPLMFVQRKGEDNLRAAYHVTSWPDLGGHGESYLFYILKNKNDNVCM